MCVSVCAVHGMNLKGPKFFSVCSPVRECGWSACFYLWSGPVVLVIVAVDGYAAVVGDRPRHGCHSCDDACCRVVTHDGVCCLAVFPSATEDEDLPVAH